MTNSGNCILVVVSQRNGLRDAGGLPHRIEQFIEVNRLGQIIDRAIAHRGHGIADVGEGGDEQDRQGGVFLARAPQRFQAGQPRHPHVGNHHGEFPGAEHFQGAFAGIRQRGFKTLAAEKGIQQAALAGVVVHNQDARSTLRSIATEDGCFGRMVAGFGHGSKLSDSDAAFQAADTGILRCALPRQNGGCEISLENSAMRERRKGFKGYFGRC